LSKQTFQSGLLALSNVWKCGEKMGGLQVSIWYTLTWSKKWSVSPYSRQNHLK
jgi:hypothetical protein